MPLTGADHRERIMLGLAVASRHAAITPALKRLGLGKLVDKEEKRQAVCIGLAMRLAYTISGGAVSVLEQFRLQRKPEKLVLTAPEDAHILVGNAVQRRLRVLAEKLDLDYGYVSAPDRSVRFRQAKRDRFPPSFGGFGDAARNRRFPPS